MWEHLKVGGTDLNFKFPPPDCLTRDQVDAVSSVVVSLVSVKQSEMETL